MTPAATEPSPLSDHLVPEFEGTRKGGQVPIPIIDINGVLGTQDTNQTHGNGDVPSDKGTHTGGGLHNGSEAHSDGENSSGLEVLSGVESHAVSERTNETIPKHGIRNKLLEQVVRTPGRMPSPQPTHLSVAPPAVHRVLQEEGPGYVAPKFEGKELQMDQGKF